MKVGRIHGGALVSWLLVLGGCGQGFVASARPVSVRPRVTVDDPELARRLPALQDALAADGDARGPWLLSYDVESHDGPWRFDIAFSRAFYAERRTRLDGKGAYAFGVDRFGAWLRVGDGPTRVADAAWAREAHTRSAIFRLDFLAPRARDEALYLPRKDEAWDYVFRPYGGHTLTFLVDSARGAPTGWDVLDEFGRLSVCEDVTWTTLRGRRVPEDARCFTLNGFGRTASRAISTHYHVRSVAFAQTPPDWARTDSGRARAPCIVEPVELPMDDELEVHVPVASPSGGSARFLLDSGAFHTYVDEEAAARLGVVPTGEVPLYTEPAWLPADTAWIGVLDRVTVAGVALDGVRVFVMDGLTESVGADGLLGSDFFRRFVVDVDTPTRTVRLWPHGEFDAPPEAAGFVMSSMQSTARITGVVSGVDRGSIALDTGAPVRLVVSSPRMAAVRPRRRGSDIGPSFGDMARSPDYLTNVDGLVLGPFAFPEMPAWGRDRELARLGEGIGLVGMGTMRHLRMMFDLRNRQLYASAGPSFDVLWRSGLELDDADTGAEVTLSLPGSRAFVRGVRAGDVLVGIEGVPVRDALRARQLLASHRGGSVRLMFLRRGYPRNIDVALDVPPDTSDTFRTAEEPARLPRDETGCTADPP